MAERVSWVDIFDPERTAQKTEATRINAPPAGDKFDLEGARQANTELQQWREEGRNRYDLDLTNEEFLRLDRVARNIDPDEGSTEGYDDTVFRYGTALKLSRMYGMSFDSAYSNLDTIMKSEYPHAQVPREWYRVISDAFQLSHNNDEIILLMKQFRAVGGNTEKRNEIYKKVQELKQENLSLHDGVSRNLVVEGLKTFGESSGIMARSMAARGLAGMVNPALGFVAGAAVNTHDMTYLAFTDFLDQGMPEDVAWPAALLASTFEGIVEQAAGPEALFSGSGLGKLIFKKMALGNAISQFARAFLSIFPEAFSEGSTEVIQQLGTEAVTELGKRATEKRVQEAASRGELRTPEEMDAALEQAAEDLATEAYREYQKAVSKSPDALLPRSSKEERNSELWQSFKGGALVTLILGLPSVPGNTVVNIREMNQINTAKKAAADFETFDAALQKSGNKTYMNFTEETRREIFSAAEEQRKQETARVEEELRRSRLYSGEDASGEIYRDGEDNLYAENSRHTESSGITTGEYAAGNPKKTENNTYARVSYELDGDTVTIDRVRMAEGYEDLQPEILQGFANDQNQEFTWEGETYTPQEGAKPALHIGWDETRKAGTNAAAAPSRANAGGLKALTGKEKQFFDSIRALPEVKSDIEAMAGLEAVRLNAALNNQTLEEHLGADFDPRMITAAKEDIQAAAQEDGGRKKGAVSFDPETGKAMIHAFAGSDISTVLHEGAHVLRRKLTGEYLAEAERVFGVTDGLWTRENEEDFSRAYEKYLETGNAPTPKLADLFQKFKEFMGRIYRLIKNGHNLTDDQRTFFDRVFRDAQENLEVMERKQTPEKTAPGGTRKAVEASDGVKPLNDTAKAPAGETPLFQPDMSPEDEVINNPEAGFTEKAQAVVDKAGKTYAMERLDPADRKHGPTAALLAQAMRIADPAERERVMGEIRALRERYAGEPGEYKAPNGKDSLLIAELGEEKGRQAWYAVRTPSFKQWFGDWEALAIQEEFNALVLEATNSAKISSNDLRGKMYLREVTPEEATEIKRQSGIDVSGMKHEITAKELHHALKRHGQPNEAQLQPGQRQLTTEDISLIPAVIDAPTEIKVQPHGKNKTSIIYGRDFGNGKIEYVERVIETSNEFEPRLTTKTVWVQDADIGVKSNTTAVYTPLRNSSVPFANGPVNPSEVSKVIDENGEPLPVYHGREDIDGLSVFDMSEREGYKGRILAGAYFSANKEYASSYPRGYGNPTVAAFLNIKNPLYTDDYPLIANINATRMEDFKSQGFDGVVLHDEEDGQFLEIAVFSPTQIKSATGNAGTFSRENPSILFQDDDLAAFMADYPGLVKDAATFDSWEEFRDYFLTMYPEISGPADDTWYKTVWDEAKKVIPEGETGTDIETEPRTVEDFLDLVNTDEGLYEITELINNVRQNEKYSPQSDAEIQQREAERQAVNVTFSNPAWDMTDKNGKLDDHTKTILRGMVRNNPLPYMESYAVLSGDERWLPGESERARLSRLDRGREQEIENASPEQLRRIAREISYEGVEKDIENGTLQMDDPRIEAHDQELRKRKNDVQEKIDQKKAKLSDYEWMTEYAERAIKKEQRIADQLARNTAPEGLTASRKQQAKIKKLEQEARKLRMEYNNFIKSLDATARKNFQELRGLRNQLYETEKQLRAVNEVREIRKKLIRAVVRKVDLKTVNIDQARTIRAIQSFLYRDMYKTIPKFIGPKAKNIRQLIADFASNEDYRRTLRISLNPAKYNQIERIIYRDMKTREVRNYQDITKAQRNKLYTLLLENEDIFKELGIDNLEPVGAVDPAVLESLNDILPADILFKLEHQSLAEWTLEDMETLAGYVSEIRAKGREEMKVKNAARQKIIADERNRLEKQIRRNMRAGDDDEDDIQGVASTENKEKRRGSRWEKLYSQMNPRRFFRMLDGSRDEVFYAIITQGEYKAYDEKMRFVTERREKVDKALEKAGIKPKELWTNTFQVEMRDGLTPVTLDEMLFFHRAGLNDRAYNAVVFGDFATTNEKTDMTKIKDIKELLSLEQKAIKRYNAAMDQLEEFLSKNEKFRVVEEIIGADFDGHYDRLKSFVAKEFNQDLGSEEYYIPLKRLMVTGETLEQETMNDVLAAAGVAVSIDKGFTFSRIDIAPAHQTPVRAGLYKTWDGMVEKQEHLMAYTPYLRKIRQIFEGRGSEKLMNDIKKRYSLAANDYIKNFISEIANPQALKGYSALDGWARLFRGHYPTAVLSWRVSSIIKQAITSPPPFFQYVNPGEYLAAAVKCFDKKTLEKIVEKSVYMKTRVYDPAIEMVKQLEKMVLDGPLGKAESVLAKIESAGMKGLEWIDFACVAPGWLAAYEHKLAELTKNNSGMADAVIDAEAVRWADQVVRDTQPSGNQMDLASIFKGEKSAIKQILLQFQVPMSVILQNIVFDAPAAVRQGHIFRAITTVGLYAITAAVVGILEEDDDDEKLSLKNRGIDALGGLIESVPVYGSGAANAVEGLLRTGKVRPSFNNWFPITGSLGRTVNAVSDEKWAKAWLNASDALFYATGLPAGLKREIEKAADEGDWTVLLGNR